MLTDEMINLIGKAALSFVATVNDDGTPNVAPIASLTVHDGALMFANMAAVTTVANLRRNPAVTIAVVDVFRRRGFRFRGYAVIRPRGTPDYDSIAEWVWSVNGRGFPISEVVRIEIDSAAPILSPAYLFGKDVTEATVETAFHRRYGVKRLET